MFKKKAIQPNPIERQHEALSYIRDLSDDDWKRFKRAAESYRKSDKILAGEEGEDDSVFNVSDEFIETPDKQ